MTKKATKPKKSRKKRQKISLSEAKDPDSGAVNPFDLLSDETGGGVDGNEINSCTKRAIVDGSSNCMAVLKIKFSNPVLSLEIEVLLSHPNTSLCHSGNT